MRKGLNVILPRNVKIRTCYTGKRLSSCFKIISKKKFSHEHDLLYHVKCPEELCTDDYIGESGRRVIERVKDHNGRDKSSHMLRHSIEKNHAKVTANDFKVIERNYRNNVQKQVAEALLIKQFRPTLKCPRIVSCFETFKLIHPPIITCSRLAAALTMETSE